MSDFLNQGYTVTSAKSHNTKSEATSYQKRDTPDQLQTGRKATESEQPSIMTHYDPSAIADRIASNVGGVQYEDHPQKGTVGGSTPQAPITPAQTAGDYTGSKNGHASGIGYSAQPSFPTTTQEASKPNVTDVGLNLGGQSITDKVKQANTVPTSGTADIGGGSVGGVRSTGTTPSSVGTGTDGGILQQAQEVVQTAATRVQEVAQPYVQKVQEATSPYVNTAVEKTAPVIQQARESAQPYVNAATDYAKQGYQTAAVELDKRGVNYESTQQALAGAGQNLKDLGVVGQQRAGEYFQQAVDQAKTIGSDRENKNIVATIFGAIALIWLAFGFGLASLLALGVAGTIAAVLSRYSTRAHGRSGGVGTSGQSKVQGTINPTRSSTGVETHYPNPSHPDNSLNAQKF